MTLSGAHGAPKKVTPMALVLHYNTQLFPVRERDVSWNINDSSGRSSKKDGNFQRAKFVLVISPISQKLECALEPQRFD